jgi:acyl phosphate:glycerol-3-phosphate acyltransferase
MNLMLIVILFIAYVLGSVPNAVWYGKVFFGIDVREHGSGNAGATNTLRTLGNKAGFVVFFLDILKGFLATNLVVLLKDIVPQSEEYFQVQMLLGAFAVLGHIYPVFAKFKGGKGIATLVGVLSAMDYRLILLLLLTFIIIVSITRFISVGSMISAILSPIYVGLLYNWQQQSFLYFCLLIALLVVYTHRANIKRLIAGNENKFTFSKKGTIK